MDGGQVTTTHSGRRAIRSRQDEGRVGMSGSDEEGDAGGTTAGGIPYDSKRQADLYWRQIEQLKGAAVCIRLYRNRLARRVKTVEII